MADIKPDWTQGIRVRLSSLRLSPTREAEIVEELSQHLDDRWRELTAGGIAPAEATRVALAEFRDGDLLARYMAPLRQAHAPAPIAPGAPPRHALADLWQDLRYAARTLAAAPAFTAIAVVSLSLGIGADTAIFSLWNSVLRAPLPAVTDPGQLVILSNPDDSGSWTGHVDGPRSWLTYEEFEQLRDHADSFSGVMAAQSSLNTWQIRVAPGSWESARGRMVSGGFFEVLGVAPAIGRLFTAAGDRSDAPDAVLSYDYWQRRFAGRPDIIGTAFTLRNVSFTIVGVAPPGFIGETSGQRPDMWLPLRTQPQVMPGRDRLHDTPPEKAMWLHVFGRLKPGVTMQQAGAQANALFMSGLESFYGEASSPERRRELLNQRLEVRSGARGASATRSQFSQSLTALLVAVAVLLLIACANLASLLLARGTARQPEIALRLSLGASRWRLVRQLVTESLVLAVMGTIGALLVSSLLHEAMVAMIARSDSRFDVRFGLEPRVLMFLVAAASTAVFLFGVLPAWRVTSTDPGARLTDRSRGALGSRRQTRSGRLLVSLQLALSLPLLVGAGLMARTVYNLERADLGFPSERLALVRVDLRDAGYEGARRGVALQQLSAAIRRLPGVQSVTFSDLGIFSGGESSGGIEVEGFVPGSDADRESALDVVGPDYFTTLGVPVILGRDILESDRDGAPKVCVINEAFAKRFFAGRSPIGLHVSTGDEKSRTVYQVVGVVKNARTQGLRANVDPRYYVSAAQHLQDVDAPTFEIRTSMALGSILPAVRAAVGQVDPALPLLWAKSLEEQMAPLTAQDRTTAQLAVVFGGVALALAAIGLYGVLSHGVARRTGEIAIRLALGAQSTRVLSMIMKETLGLVFVGVAVGGGLAFTASRLIDSRLYGVAPRDPLTLAGAIGVLLLSAIAAAYLPARRASKVDPMTTLRQQH